jgi:hypothetical protein
MNKQFSLLRISQESDRIGRIDKERLILRKIMTVKSFIQILPSLPGVAWPGDLKYTQMVME